MVAVQLVAKGGFMGLIAWVAGMWQWEQVRSWVKLRRVVEVLGSVELMKGLE